MLLSRLVIEIHGPGSASEDEIKAMLSSQWGPKTVKSAREILAAAGLSFAVTGSREDFSKPTAPKPTSRSVAVKGVISSVKAPKPEPVAPRPSAAKLEAMTRAQLLEYCDQFEIELGSGYQSKVAIISAIRDRK